LWEDEALSPAALGSRLAGLLPALLSGRVSAGLTSPPPPPLAPPGLSSGGVSSDDGVDDGAPHRPLIIILYLLLDIVLVAGVCLSDCH
jgi:hypothetical protein